MTYMPSRSGSSPPALIHSWDGLELRRASLLLLVLASCAGQVATPVARRPNVVLVITDDQGYGDLGCHGNPQIHTPNVDALARQSIELERFHVCPVCSPTRASLLTGRYNYRTGIVDTSMGRSLMYPDEITLAEMLRDAGYRTGIFGKWHLGDNYPMRAIDQGFQEALTLKGGGIGQPSDPPGGDHYQDPTLYRNGKAFKSKGYVTDLVTDGALGFIASHRDEPFFAYIAYNAPHTPLEVPEGYLERYKDLPDTTARIYAMETNIDDNVGRMLKKLDDLGLAKDTIFIFMTDNGPQQADRYNAGMRGRKGTVFDGGIRVPFFIRWPGRFDGGRKIDRIAAHIDVTPTLLEACGVPKPAVKMDGVSLVPLLAGTAKDWPDRTIFFQWHRGDEPVLGRECAARSQKWKLVRPQPVAKPMLFDMEADPLEKTDLADAHPEEAKRLNAAYEAWFRDVGSTRGYTPSRIHIGNPAENPTVLTRQDMRGPKAGWANEALGHWEIDVERAGTYEVKLLFHGKPTRVSLDVAGVKKEVDVPQGAREVTLTALSLPSGPARLEPSVMEGANARAVDYVEVKRVD